MVYNARSYLISMSSIRFVARLALRVLFFLSFLVGFALLGFSSPALAARCDPNSGLGAVFGCRDVLPKGGVDVSSIITAFFIVLVVIGGLISSYYFVLGGIALSQSKEDPEKRAKATKAIFNSVLGMVATLLAGSVYFLVGSVFGGPSELKGSPCLGVTSYNVSFTGFTAPNNPNVCVLTNNDGKIIRAGCVTTVNQPYDDVGGDATPDNPSPYKPSDIRTGSCGNFGSR